MGVILVSRRIVVIPPVVNSLAPVYFHLLMVGWVTQLIIGVVYWMFPKASRERPRGSEALGWATYGMLNIGLLLRVAGEPLVVSRSEANIFGCASTPRRVDLHPEHLETGEGALTCPD